MSQAFPKIQCFQNLQSFLDITAFPKMKSNFGKRPKETSQSRKWDPLEITGNDWFLPRIKMEAFMPDIQRIYKPTTNLSSPASITQIVSIK